MEENYAAYRATTHFGSLDGLRCLSILLVIWHHAGGHIIRGYLGVDLFFVISGYLITTLLLRERARYGALSLSKFYARRTLRIFPLYYAVLALYIAMTVLVPEHTEVDAQAHREFFRNLPYFATYTSNWFVEMNKPRVIFFFAWSLAAEEQFYLVWPLVLRWLPRAYPVILAAMFLCVGLVLFNQKGPGGGFAQEGPLVLTAIASIPPFICGGCLLAFALDQEATFRVAYRFLGRRASAAAALVVTMALLATPAPSYLSVPAMVWLVGSCCIRPATELTGLLTNQVFVRVGRVSYGMYLYHMIALNFARRVLHLDFQVGLWLATAVFAFVLATLSFRYFETPFLMLKARYHRVGPASVGPDASLPPASLPPASVPAGS